MKYNDLSVSAKRNKIRVGRGISAGRGKTAGRGTKGQNARAGASKRPGFEGGQNPLMQRLPKLSGFRSHRPKAANISTSQLDKLSTKRVDSVALAEAGLIPNAHLKIKLLAGDAPKKAFEVRLPAASAKAVELVKKAGGSFTATEQTKRQPKEKPAAKTR